MAAEIEEQMTWWLPSLPVKLHSTDPATSETLTKKKKKPFTQRQGREEMDASSRPS